MKIKFVAQPSERELSYNFLKDTEEFGSMRAVINRAKSKGFSASKLTVLSPQKDHFRLATPTHRMNAKWFADQVERFIPNGNIHLRGLHYKCNGNVFLPSGGISQPMRYINSDECW